MTDIIIALILIIAVGGASFYIYKAKKNGQACIGCPHSKECGKNKCNCSCSDNSKFDK